MHVSLTSLFLLLAIGRGAAEALPGASLVFVKGGDAWIMSTDGSNQRALTSVGTVAQVVLSNGVVVYRSAGQLWKTTTLPGASAVAIPNTSGVLEFDLNPTGDKLVLTFGANLVIYTMNIDGSNLQVLNSTGSMHQIYPSWGRDGYIYFGQSQVGDATSQSLYRIPEAGVNNATPLTSPFSQYPAAGGPGNRVAFLVNLNLSDRTLRIMNADGSGQVSVPGAPGGIFTNPAYDNGVEVIYYHAGNQIRGINVTTGVETVLATGLDTPTSVDYGIAFSAWSLDGSFQVRYASNLNVADSVVNITNSGARGAGLPSGTSASTTGAICVNVYAFSPDEQMIACCSCPVTPNGLVSISARLDLISNTLTPAVPTSVVVKLLSTVPSGGSCTNSAANPGATTPGLLAFGTTVHASPVAGSGPVMTETQFLPARLSAGELSRLTQLCTFINATGSGFGICASCRLGGLGAGRL